MRDEELYEAVRDELVQAPGIDLGWLEIEVALGAVFLAGKVASARARHQAEQIVAGVPGVRSVHNHLLVSSTSRPSVKLTAPRPAHDPLPSV
jgi:osmotically-inducible protein OsmY